MNELTTNFFSDTEESNKVLFAERHSKFIEKLCLYGPLTVESWETQVNTMVELFKNDESRKETISGDIKTIDRVLQFFQNYEMYGDYYLKMDTTLVADLLSHLGLNSLEDLKLIPVFIESLEALANYCCEPYYMHMQDLITFWGRIKFFIHMYLLTNILTGPDKQIWRAALCIYRIKTMLSTFANVFEFIDDKISYSEPSNIYRETIRAASAKEGLTGDSINYINSLFRLYGRYMYYPHLINDWIPYLHLEGDNGPCAVTFLLNPYKNLVEFNGENGENTMWDITLFIYNSLFYDLYCFSKPETRESELLKLREDLEMILRIGQQMATVIYVNISEDTLFRDTFRDIAKDLKFRVCDSEQILNLKELDVAYPDWQTMDYIHWEMLNSNKNLIDEPEARKVYGVIHDKFIASYNRYYTLCSQFSDKDEDNVKKRAEINTAFIETNTLKSLVYQLRENEMSHYGYC